MDDKITKRINRDPVKRKTRISVSFNKSTIEIMKTYANVHNMSVSLFVSEVVRDYIDKYITY